MDVVIMIRELQEMYAIGRWGNCMCSVGRYWVCGYTWLTQVHQTLVDQILNGMPQSGTAISPMSRPLMVCTMQIHPELRWNRLRWRPGSESSQ